MNRPLLFDRAMRCVGFMHTHTTNTNTNTNTTPYLKKREGVFEVSDVEHRQLELDVPVVPGAIDQQLAEQWHVKSAAETKEESNRRKKERKK